MKVLIADDHTILRQSLKLLLTEALPNCVVGEAPTGQAVLDQTKRERWDVIVLDIGLPKGNGLDVLKILRRSYPKLPVLILSGYGEEEYAVRAIRAGAAGYLTKDKAFAELVRALKELYAGRKFITASVADKLATALARDAEHHEKNLSDREFQVLHMIINGQTITEIADELALSVKTVSTYHTRLIDKLGVHTDAELTRYALANKLVS